MFWRTGGLSTSYGYLGRGGLFELHGPSVRTAVAVKWGTKRLGLETRGLGGLEGLGQPDCPLTPAAAVSRVASQDRPPLPSPRADYLLPSTYLLLVPPEYLEPGAATWLPKDAAPRTRP